jgi:uncharacterized protein YjbJ (UPF0337 family)
MTSCGRAGSLSKRIGPRHANLKGSVANLLLSTQKEQNMKSSTKDQVEGTLHEMKGKAKETAGKVTNNPNLTAKGQSEKIAGKIQKKVGQIEKVLEK